MSTSKHLLDCDPEIAACIQREASRQQQTLTLIAAETVTSTAVQEALRAPLSEISIDDSCSLPHERHSGSPIGGAEELAASRAKVLFGAEHVNVCPHSGALANMAVYLSALKLGDTILGPDLAHGGHTSAGHASNYSSQLFTAIHYGVRADTERIDLDQVEDLARQHRPKLIVVGGTAFPRHLDFKAFHEIASRVGAYLSADITHVAGLLIAGLHPTPIGLADFVTTSTSHTLRGPRGGIVIAPRQRAGAVDRAVMPGVQSSALANAIAAKAVAFLEVSSPGWRIYQQRAINNAAVLAQGLVRRGYRLVTGGSDTHLLLLDLTTQNLTGKDAQEALEQAGIVVNKNPIPFDRRGLLSTSGIRLGTLTLTTRGMREAEMEHIADLIHRVLTSPRSAHHFRRVRSEVGELCDRFRIPD
jgi:glycine hydroxymethyltransferase